ncbi:hypothetical protein [Pseudarthrobacter sp. N5]|uniref:hypothetical protein n=1 Tax=Pseudarthrobacter sp. N5 TaxID=3418416 RepID=UPI003CE6A7CF
MLLLLSSYIAVLASWAGPRRLRTTGLLLCAAGFLLLDVRTPLDHWGALLPAYWNSDWGRQSRLRH